MILEALEFSATWCGPCKKLEPLLHKIQEEFPEVKLTKLDVDDFPEKAKEYGIRSVPTVILIRDGKEEKRIVGLTLIEPLRVSFRNLVKGKESG